MKPPPQIQAGQPSPPKQPRGIQPKQVQSIQLARGIQPKQVQGIHLKPPRGIQLARGIQPKPVQGIQLALAARPASAAPSRVPSLPHPPCPICAGPTARHAGRAVCVLCGHGAQERGIPYHPRRHPN